MSTPLRIGLVGFGNIGTGVVDTLAKNRDLLDERCPRRLELRRVADIDIDTPREVEVDRSLLTTDTESVLRDPEIDVIVELIGGLEPARTFVETALKNGKHVVTANKAMLAHHGADLLALAAEKRVRLFFEAAVGGGIPVVRALTECLAANRITRIEGILNGTCNYILTRMYGGVRRYVEKESYILYDKETVVEVEEDTGFSFEDALAEAQELGYAEPDPTADIEGMDAAHKIAILASLAFGLDIRYDDVARRGIRDLTTQDLKSVEAAGFVFKHLAVAEIDDCGAVAVSVQPTLVCRAHPLAEIGGVLNAVIFEGRPVGAVMFTGPGAGPQTTSNAVVSDLMALSRIKQEQAPPTCFLTVPVGRRPLRKQEAKCDGYWLRVITSGDSRALASIADILARNGIPMEKVTEDRWEDDETDVTRVVQAYTGEARNEDVLRAASEIDSARWRQSSPVTLTLPRREMCSVPDWHGERQ
jgi:homoserine dehydrogenase